MELKCISQTTANFIMDALMYAWMELVADYNEELVEEGISWVRGAFIRFCEVNNIDLVEEN